PVAVDVAVPVQAAAEADPRELAGVEVDLGLAQPRRQRRGVRTAVHEAAVARAHADAPRRAPTRRRIAGVARAPVEQPPDRGLRIALEVGLGHAGLLEVELVE